MIKPELLAPAGSIDCLKAAILAGADAVYLAGKRFGARAFANNFDENELKWARKVTNNLNKKLYITLNTIVFEHEWHLLTQTLDFLEILQPDSLIIQDLGIAVELKNRGSKIPLHLSTQGAWFGQGGIEELKELGISRIILPRETSKNEISEIVKNSPFEIEVFVHGAMCYSISGRCYWSSTLGTRSGNRGTCAQPCRKEYNLENSKTNYPLFSPKDLRLFNQIKPLIETGVSSLKIEGRMKSPEYVYQVVKDYRKAIDGENIDNTNLDEVFSRASSTAFFFGVQKNSEWKTGKNNGREGIVVGYTTGKNEKGLTEILLKQEIKAGDGLFWYINNKKEGSKLTFVQKNNKNKNLTWVRGLPNNLPNNTELRRTSSNNEENWLSKWDKSCERYPIEIRWSGKVGTPLTLETCINNKNICLKSDELLEIANSKGLEEGPLQEKFNIIGDDYKVTKHITNNLDHKLYLSVATLKTLKRLLLDKITSFKNISTNKVFKDEYCTLVEHKISLSSIQNTILKGIDSNPIRLRLWNETEFLSKALNVNCLVIPWNERFKVPNNIIVTKQISYWLPPILNANHFGKLYNELKSLKKGKFLCWGWEAFKLAKLLPQLDFEIDWCFNVANKKFLNYILEKGIGVVLSKEWKLVDIPKNIAGYKSNYSWNPLVSYTRFANAINTDQIASNSHHDNFFTLAVGNGITAMFLEKNLNKLSKLKDFFQIDVAISPKENPIQVVENLNRIINL